MLHPFRIETTDAALDDLRERLLRTRLPENRVPGWDDGIDLGYLAELVTYWRDQFDWKAQEEKLNRFNQLRGSIDGTTAHVIHERGNGPAPMPIVLTHGWPDSPFRFDKLIPLLTDPGAHGGDPADAFHVVAPSLPGFGFSLRDGAYGGTMYAFGSYLDAVMRELGYERYGAHGGDMGTGASVLLAAHHPQSLIGMHLTDILPLHAMTPLSDLSPEEGAYLQELGRFQQEEGAYMHLQGTKPWTPAAALMDSPAGLAAWIVEKFRAWSDCNGDVESRFSKDELLTNVMLYWLTGSIGSSFLAYRDFIKPAPRLAGQEAAPLQLKVDQVPAGFSIFAKDQVHPPRSWAERFYDVRHWNVVPCGGHFGAFEEPELLAGEIREFFRPLRK
ncbi:epoxide hydrolase family protein [Ralstonia solanacearum]|uniref:Epoxide hydrolase N-terminal domain-containing protein n=1 Tax=Ralstonia solanacearum TaxID=305 RepID=A0AAD0SFM5_RALSL|nr:epoxide hydrolase family protein [Ralstonia solanacearum]AXV83182.1 hypothetical protein CJO77_12395 [Ralstonia solanacearum]AXW54313.1 hypothetical protein CJO92_12395 [Ralstonia solanacearum]